MRGDSEFATFSVGQRASLIIATTFGGDEAAVTVTWAGRRDKRESWTTDL